jgi:hypothetical protein
MATLTEYLVENRQKTDGGQQDYFNRTKPVPEFALERAGLGANLTSLFEQAGSGVRNPPHRIARDPRFRTQSKDGGNGHAGDDWGIRHDPFMGGRW